MDELILDFAGERLQIPAGFATERSVSQIGMKVEHDGQMYKVVDRQIFGVDEVAEEMRNLHDEESVKNKLTLVIFLERV